MVDFSPSRSRVSKREQIRAFFLANLKQSFSTAELHTRFGTAFRTRVSDLNHDDDCPIVIRNVVRCSADGERSWYYAEWRSALPATENYESGLLFDVSPEPRYPD